MNVVWKIAYRNLREHKLKTLIVGLLITLGVAVLVVGNSLMDTAARGIERTYVESYTGHLLITARLRGNLTLFGLEGQANLGDPIPTVPEYEKIWSYVRQHPLVQAASPQAIATARVDFGNRQSFVQLFGIEPTAYRAMFPDNLELVSGQELKPGEEGILLSEHTVQELAGEQGPRLKPGDSVILTGMSEIGGIKVREVPVRGIFRFRRSNPVLDAVALADIVNVRALAGMNVGEVTKAELSQREKALLEEVNEEDLFSAPLVTEVQVQRGGSSSLLAPLGGTGATGGTSAKERPTVANQPADAARGPWHFVLVKVRPGVAPAAVQRDLQTFFAANGIEAMVSGWLAGAGGLGRLAYGTKLVFNVVVLVIAVVAVIIIMNTLVISVSERTAEIGTMRALGAQKAFVRRVIMWETIMTAGLFGLLGIILGCLVLGLLNWRGIQAPNVFFEILFGGKVLHPVPSWGSIVTSLLMVVGIGVVSSLYPVSIALRIPPVRAMQES